MTTLGGPSTPASLTDDQIQALAAGDAPAFGEPARPRALTDKDVESLRDGKHKGFEKLPVLGPQG